MLGKRFRIIALKPMTIAINATAIRINLDFKVPSLIQTILYQISPKTAPAHRNNTDEAMRNKKLRHSSQAVAKFSALY